jgi:hypothetical protein
MSEAETLATVLGLVAGYEIRLGHGLAVCRLDEDSYIVEYETPGKDGEAEFREKSFKLASKAAEFFVEQRHKQKLGADFENPDDE